MALDKYGTGDDPYCYPGSNVLQNLLNIEDDEELAEAEAKLTELAVEEIEFDAPPYDLDYFQSLHRQVFADVFEWAGELRSIDMSKGTTRFCTCKRIAPEAGKLFQQLAGENYFEGYEREAFVAAIAEFYIELNMVHPFREGNGRAQRLLFEHIISILLRFAWLDAWQCNCFFFQPRMSTGHLNPVIFGGITEGH